jgi:hypothetical protein
LPVSLCAGVHRKSVNANRPNLITITISQFALAGSGQPPDNRLNNVLQRIPKSQPIFIKVQGSVDQPSTGTQDF